MTPRTRSDETVDIGPSKRAGGGSSHSSHMQVRVLSTKGHHISAHFEETRGLLRRDGTLSVLKYG